VTVVDEVRLRAEAHAEAMVAGELRVAAADLAPNAAAAMRSVAPHLPRPVESAEVLEVVDADAGAATVVIHYTGGGVEVSVRSRWELVDGRWQTTDLAVV
jgi:hypothetical protein